MSELNFIINLAKFGVGLVVHYIVASLFLVINIFSFLLIQYQLYFGGKEKITAKKNVVVITGCDTGFGEATSIRLSQMGFHVISACYSKEGAARLKDIVALAVQCDVTKEEDISSLVEQTATLLETKKLKLWGLVCNAGIGNSGAVDWISSSTFRRVLEVNLFGVVNVTKAFLPLLKQTRGARIVNLSSVAGFLPAPMMAAYDASKHAVEGYAKALRLEMKPWNIHVSNINPGFMRTPIVTGGPTLTAAEWERVPEELKEQYDPLMPNPDTAMKHLLENPSLVVDAIQRAITDRNPPMWYFPGIQSQFLFQHMTTPSTFMFMDRLWRLLPSSPEPQPKPEVVKAMQKPLK